MKDGRLAAGMNVNVWDVNDAIAAIVASQKPVDADRLRDPGIELAQVVQ